MIGNWVFLNYEHIKVKTLVLIKSLIIHPNAQTARLSANHEIHEVNIKETSWRASHGAVTFGQTFGFMSENSLGIECI